MLLLKWIYDSINLIVRTAMFASKTIQTKMIDGPFECESHIVRKSAARAHYVRMLVVTLRNRTDN